MCCALEMDNDILARLPYSLSRATPSKNPKVQIPVPSSLLLQSSLGLPLFLHPSGVNRREGVRLAFGAHPICLPLCIITVLLGSPSFSAPIRCPSKGRDAVGIRSTSNLPPPVQHYSPPWVSLFFCILHLVANFFLKWNISLS